MARPRMGLIGAGLALLALPALAQPLPTPPPGPAAPPGSATPLPPGFAPPAAMPPAAAPDLGGNYNRLAERRRAEERALIEFMLVVPALRLRDR